MTPTTRSRQQTAGQSEVGAPNSVTHYTLADAQHYAAHHQKNWRTRLTTWRERSMLQRALASLGPLESILDIPCGAGRFWSVLVATGARRLFAADNSDGMLTVAHRNEPTLSNHITLLNSSIFDIDLPPEIVDCCVVPRFFHHLAHSADRCQALRELHRVSRRFVLLSLWVDGNLQARRRRRKDAAVQPTSGFGARRCIARTVIEAEFLATGFTVRQRCDVAPGLSMWRLYVLEKAGSAALSTAPDGQYR